MAAPQWTPLVDISEEAQEYLIEAQLLAVNKEDVKATAEGVSLTPTLQRILQQPGHTHHEHWGVNE